MNVSSGASCSYIAAGSTAFTACSSREIKENNGLKSENMKLKSQMDSLESRIAALEKLSLE